MPILLDEESLSRADLKKVGGRNYWEHPSTEMLCCVCYDTDSGEIEVWERGQPRPKMICNGAELGAHNMNGFDRFGLVRKGWRGLNEGPPLIDTSELARAAGLPGALDALATRWLGLAKDKDASRFTKGLSSVRRPSKGAGAITPADWKLLTPDEKRERGAMPECGPAEMARVVPYCLSDVEVLAHGWPVLELWQGIEPQVQRVERAINDRGVCFDVQLAKRLLEEDARNCALALEQAARELGAGWTAERVRQVANSPKQFSEATGALDATKARIESMLKDPTASTEEIWLARARQSLASIARGKLEAGLARVSPDGRLRDSHRYAGAHTMRWSGRGMQLQNMPRPVKRFETWHDAEICALADRVLAGEHCDADEIDLLLRACVNAKPGHTLIVEDFSGVEARALSWAAGDKAALAVHTGTLDPYKVAATSIFSCSYEAVNKDQRQAGKVAELACGYGGGAGAIERFAETLGVNLAAAGVDAQTIVDAWRAAHRPTVNFWYACERALAAAIEGRRGQVSCFDFVPSDDGKDVAVLMPNGRPLVYNEVRLSRGDRGKPEISYLGHHMREKLYGGKIVENLIQSMTREFLAGAMVAADDSGLCPVLHVHDELVCECPASDEAEAAEVLHDIMTTVPDWAPGFPLGAAGHTGKKYRK
jgi:DNA polymerase